MGKYLYLQDSHCKGVSPARRIDDYHEAWKIKFHETMMIAKKNKVDAIFDGGDLLEIPLVANSIVDEILDEIETLGIPYYVLYGSHCMIGHHRDTSKGSSLTHMIRRCKLMRDVAEFKDDYATFKLIEHEYEVENKLKSDGIIFQDTPLWKVSIIHAFVTPKPFLQNVTHVVADDIKTNSDLVLVAHYHKPWDKKVGETQYVDIGCFGRCNIDEVDIKPSVLLLDTKKRSYEIIPLKKAKPGAEVFDLTTKEIEKLKSEDLEAFVTSLREFKGQALDLKQTIINTGKECKTDQEVIDLILSRMTTLELQEK